MDWSVKVQAWVDGGERKAKGTVAYLDSTLYRSLHMDAREKVNLSVRSDEIVLIPWKDEDENPQIKMIENILKIVAMDTTVDHITTMVRLKSGEHHFVLKSGETIKDYICVFNTSALGYLNMVIASEESSERARY